MNVFRAVVLTMAVAIVPPAAFAQTCPQPLKSALRLVLVVADAMIDSRATVVQFERAGPDAPWQQYRAPATALIGYNGVGWAYEFRRYARRGEPVKREGDKRVPAGFFKLGASFGIEASQRPGYLRTAGMTCVDDLRSAAYNTIVPTATLVGKVHGEAMGRVPEYARGLLVDYPTNREARAGSCIFIHLQLPAATGTRGCVALPEPQLNAVQDFAEPGAVLAVLARNALARFKGCLPAIE